MSSRRVIRSFAVAMGFFAVIPATTLVSAQELNGDPDLGQRVFRELSYCGDCHGWAGDGVPNVAQFSGANLREIVISPETAFEVIRCGRPGTEMPSFRRNSWTEIIPCYGMTAALEGQLQPDNAATQLSDRFIEALVAFIFQDFVGAGPVTREYCEGVFGEGSTRCGGYPAAAEIAPAN